MTEEALRSAYQARLPSLKLMGDWVVYVVKKELRSLKNISFETELPVKPRTKDIDSFMDKALRRNKRYKDPLSEIQDQVGVRFVFLLKDQVDAAVEIIRSIGSFRIDNSRDSDREIANAPERFGYKSEHFVVYPTCEMPFREKTIVPDIPCEIQVRTLLEHTFAQISHECNYKPSLKLPDNKKCKLRRVLAQGAALTEVTDAVFGEVKHEIDEYTRHAKELFALARKHFSKVTGDRSKKDTPATLLLLDAYRKDLDDMKLDDLKKWMKINENLLSTLGRRRDECAIYNDPVIILLGYVATKNARMFQKNWCADSADLRDVCSFFGIGIGD